jgi:hypothetical protein
MPTQRPALLNANVGDVVAIALATGGFCYIRKYAFGYGVLPFLSRTPRTAVSALPTLEPAFFIHVWLSNYDTTPMFHVGHAPFPRQDDSWGRPAYYPPDAIEPCYKIHGVFNGLFSIIKPVSEADVVGLDRFQRYQPADLSSVLFSRCPQWDWLVESEEQRK